MTDQAAWGRMEARMAHLEKQNDELRADIKELKALMNRGRGAVWVLGALGAVAAAMLTMSDKLVKLIS